MVMQFLAKIKRINCTFKEFFNLYMFIRKHPLKYFTNWGLALFIIAMIPMCLYGQDSTSKRFDPNQNKLVKKINSILDSTQKKIKGEIANKATNIKDAANSEINKVAQKVIPEEDDRPLPYEILLNKKYNLGRRAYQNTVSQFNYLFNAEEELKDIIQKARNQFQEDYTNLLSFYDYDLTTTSKSSIDSIVYRCNANIVLHDLRSNWVDDAYLLLAKAYLFHRNFDTAASILQFINYSFDEKENGIELPIGSNLRNTNGNFSIANKEDNRIWENANVRNESMIWQARNYIESNQINEGISLLQLLKSDAVFPKRLHPFLHEQFAYAYYQTESYENAANSLISALPNAMDGLAKSRWYFLIGQLFQKANKTDEAYTWYKKANEFSPNPIIGVYATINMIRIESNKSKRPWQTLANELERMTKRDKYKPYKDIVYFEMAKLAIQNNAIGKANEWLISAIKFNSNNTPQKQKAFELIGEINYKYNKFDISKIAYDSLINTLKTNPEFEIITLRKKWMGSIVKDLLSIQKEDTLQYIYTQPIEAQKPYAAHWQAGVKQSEKNLIELFSDKVKSNQALPSAVTTTSYNAFSNSNTNDFYFESTSTITQGKQNFIQKWGERPNVDAWRRKTSSSMASKSAVNTINANIADSTSVSIKMPIITADTNNIKLIQNNLEYKSSLANWNKATLNVAQTFLLKLNDFSKAKPFYQKIIERDIDPEITERAFLDMASQYLHDGNKTMSDNIISIVVSKFPNGSYNQKKKAVQEKINKKNNLDNLYEEAYLLCQLGKWEQLALYANNIKSEMYNSKWEIPFSFLLVKMYAQQKQDNNAILILDSIIYKSKNDLIREKAKNIITDLKNRKDTEQYVESIQITREQLALIDSSVNKPLYHLDTTENYYLAVIVNNPLVSITKKIKDSITRVLKLDLLNQNAIPSYSQFQENTYIIWIGPLDNVNNAKQYLKANTQNIRKAITSYISDKQFDICLIGKSNIIELKTQNDLKLYKDFMQKNIIKN
jgi:hypothetical protein